MALISIIIPNYNNKKWLKICLDSVLAQKGNFKKEIIVVDDHSEDGSWEILETYKEKYPEEFKIYYNPLKGGNQARAYGFTKSSGDFIQWLDSDDQILGDKLKKQSEHLLEHPETDIVYSDWKMDFFEDGEKIKEEIYIKQSYDFFLKELIIDNWNPTHSYLMRRKIAEKMHHINAWNPERKVAQDREYFTLAAINQAEFAYVPGMYAIYNRWSNKTVSAIQFKKRLKLSLELEHFFMQQIEKQDWIKDQVKLELISYLKTDSLKACFYDTQLSLLSKVSFKEIKWERVHYKMRFFIPFICLWKNWNYRYNRNK